MKRRRLLVLASYPPRMAATRFRACAYFPALEARGIDPELRPFMDDEFTADFYKPGHRAAKALGLAKYALRRAAQLTEAWRYDAVFVQREAAIIGPAIYEAALAKGFRIPLVFDLDDALWVGDFTASRHPLAARLLKVPSKTDRLLAMAREVIAVSDYVAQYALRRSSSVTVLPTVVSRDTWTPLPGRLDGHFADPGGVPTIGWIGTHSTATQLDMVVPALQTLAREGHRFRLRLVGASRTLDIDGVEVSSVPWQAETEIEDFRRIDVGIAPVADTEWTRGKGGFKQIQYMTVGIPMVSSPIGGAGEFLVHGGNALIARTDGDWTDHLRRLLTEEALRAGLSRAGRSLAAEHLCIEAQADAFVGVVERAMESRRGHTAPDSSRGLQDA